MAISYFIEDEAIDRSQPEPVQGISHRLSWEKLDRLLRVAGELEDNERIMNISIGSAGIKYSIIKRTEEVEA